MTDKLRAAAEETVKKLEHISRKLEGHRVWSGMKWEYHAILPSQYLPLRDFVDSQIRALRQALDQLPDTTKMIDKGIDRGAWSDVPDATKWVDELRGDDDEWDHPPQRDCNCPQCKEYWSDVYPNKGNLCGND